MPRKGEAKWYPGLWKLNDTFDSDWRWLKAHQFAWTSLCHPSRVLNSSDRRIMASEATCDHDGFNDDDNYDDDLVPNNDNVIAGKKD